MTSSSFAAFMLLALFLAPEAAAPFLYENKELGEPQASSTCRISSLWIQVIIFSPIFLARSDELTRNSLFLSRVRNDQWESSASAS